LATDITKTSAVSRPTPNATEQTVVQPCANIEVEVIGLGI